MADKPSEQVAHSPTWWGWVLIAGIAVGCTAAGYYIGQLAGFPFCPGYQGVLVQQPWPTALATLGLLAVVVFICMWIAIWLTRPMDGRFGASLALLAGAGLVYRGGGVCSVMQAADGRTVFWLMAGELAVLGLIVWGCFAGRHMVGGAKRAGAKQPFDAAAAGIQAALFAGLVWLLAQSRIEAQGMWSVFFAGVAATMLIQFAIGRTWQGSWCIPVIVGIAGYVVNAMTARGVEIANITSPAASFAMATPLMYAAMGPIGLALGELLHGEHHASSAEGTAQTA